MRLLGTNLDPRDEVTTGVNESMNRLSSLIERTTSQCCSTSHTNWQLRLELKLWSAAQRRVGMPRLASRGCLGTLGWSAQPVLRSATQGPAHDPDPP